MHIFVAVLFEYVRHPGAGCFVLSSPACLTAVYATLTSVSRNFHPRTRSAMWHKTRPAKRSSAKQVRVKTSARSALHRLGARAKIIGCVLPLALVVARTYARLPPTA